MLKHYFKGHYYTRDAIQAAYWKLARDNHPDRANIRMQEINTEREELLDQLKHEGVAGWSISKEIIEPESRPVATHTAQNHAANAAHIGWTRTQKIIEVEAREAKGNEDHVQRNLNGPLDFYNGGW
ncbi:MAG TPA: J domain-containing protein [Pyrinomonadaceae bacterium]|nr:J domain-containing protein [Pyrinomonadaceae bacterium]